MQGVFFRASTAAQARQFGINGYAKNLKDGRVEVLGCGSADAINQLIDWLHTGPPLAEVAAVEVETIDCPDNLGAGFTTA